MTYTLSPKLMRKGRTASQRLRKGDPVKIMPRVLTRAQMMEPGYPLLPVEGYHWEYSPSTMTYREVKSVYDH